jgi:CheY-like chemotaxis protein
MENPMPKIMLIEDDTTMFSLLNTLLSMEGFQVVGFNSNERLEPTLANIRREMPSLILADVNLRNFNGFDLLQAVRQDTDLCAIRVIMSSGMDYLDECQQKGADNFLLKPYMPDDLIKMIRQTINI